MVAADGPEPELEALLARRADARVTFVAHPSPRGRSAARNLASRASAAPYAAFLDDDDRLLPASLAARVGALEAAPAAVLAYGRAVATDAEGRVREGARGTKAVRARVRDGLTDQLRGRSLLPSTVCLRRSAFDAAGGFDEDLATGEDWLLFLRAARLGPFVDVGRPVALYRRHGGQARGTPAQQEAALSIWLPRFFDDPATPDGARARPAAAGAPPALDLAQLPPRGRRGRRTAHVPRRRPRRSVAVAASEAPRAVDRRPDGTAVIGRQGARGAGETGIFPAMEARLTLAWRSRVTLALAILVLGSAPAYAKKTPPANAPLAAVSPPGPLEALLDVRSPNVANEVRLALPARIVCAGRALRIEGRGDQLTAKAGPEKDVGALDTEMLVVPKLPAILTFAFHGGDRYGVAVRRDPASGTSSSAARTGPP